MKRNQHIRLRLKFGYNFMLNILEVVNFFISRANNFKNKTNNS